MVCALTPRGTVAVSMPDATGFDPIGYESLLERIDEAPKARLLKDYVRRRTKPLDNQSGGLAARSLSSEYLFPGNQSGWRGR